MSYTAKEMIELLRLLLGLMGGGEVGVGVLCLGEGLGQDRYHKIFVMYHYNGVGTQLTDIIGWKTLVIDSRVPAGEYDSVNLLFGEGAPTYGFGMTANTISEVLDRLAGWVSEQQVQCFRVVFRQSESDEWRCLTAPLHC